MRPFMSRMPAIQARSEVFIVPVHGTIHRMFGTVVLLKGPSPGKFSPVYDERPRGQPKAFRLPQMAREAPRK